MGKGDPRTKRGKLFRGSHGKLRPRHKPARKVKPELKPAPSARAARSSPTPAAEGSEPSAAPEAAEAGS